VRSDGVERKNAEVEKTGCQMSPSPVLLPSMSSEAVFPAVWPFKESDFPANAKFIVSENAPFVLLSGPTLVNFFGGRGDIIPITELKVDNHRLVDFDTFALEVEASKARPFFSS
jgi:hypothetical protein